MKAREFDREAQRYAKKSAAAQGSWKCKGCGQRISANKARCLACAALMELSRLAATNAALVDGNAEPAYRIMGNAGATL
jgi:hypothetical protein